MQQFSRRATWTVAVIILAVCCCTPANAEKRVALVIGNSHYKNVTPLDNPVK